MGNFISYLALKHVHVTAVALSVAFFALRGAWMISDSALLRARFVRIAPHVIDTVLLVSAVALAITVRQYPMVHGWLTAKVLGLVAYVVLGSIALKRGRSRGVRIAAFVAALATVAWVIGVAITKSPDLGLAAGPTSVGASPSSLGAGPSSLGAIASAEAVACMGSLA